jgi:hypothetical protein
VRNRNVAQRVAFAVNLNVPSNNRGGGRAA